MARQEHLIAIEDILAPEDRNRLGTSGCKVYAAIWNELNFKNTDAIVLTDQDVYMRSAVYRDHLPAARKRIVDAGFLEIEELSIDNNNSRNNRFGYRFIHAPDDYGNRGMFVETIQ